MTLLASRAQALGASWAVPPSNHACVGEDLRTQRCDEQRRVLGALRAARERGALACPPSGLAVLCGI